MSQHKYFLRTKKNSRRNMDSNDNMDEQQLLNPIPNINLVENVPIHLIDQSISENVNNSNIIQVSPNSSNESDYTSDRDDLYDVNHSEQSPVTPNSKNADSLPKTDPLEEIMNFMRVFQTTTQESQNRLAEQIQESQTTTQESQNRLVEQIQNIQTTTQESQNRLAEQIQNIQTTTQESLLNIQTTTQESQNRLVEQIQNIQTSTQESHGKLIGEINNLKSEIKTTQSQISKLQMENQDCNSSLKSLEKKFHELDLRMTNSYEALKNNISVDQEQILSSIKMTQEKSEAHIDSLKAELNQKIQRIEDKQESIDEAQTIIQQNQEQFIQQQKAVNLTVEKELRSVQNHADIIHLRCQTNETKIESIQKDHIGISQKLDKISTTNPNNPIIVQYPFGMVQTDSNLPKFNGRNAHPPDFINKFKKYWERRKKLTKDFSLNHFLELVEASLEGNPNKWLQMIVTKIQNEEEFFEHFNKKYWNQTIQDGLKIRLRDDKYIPTGRLNRTEYFTEKVLLFQSLLPIPDETEIVDTLIKHFDEDIRRSCSIHRVNTIRDLEEYLNYLDNKDYNNRPKNVHGNSLHTQNTSHEKNYTYSQNNNYRNRTNPQNHTYSRDTQRGHPYTQHQSSQPTRNNSDHTQNSKFYPNRSHPYESNRNNSSYTNSRTFENKQYRQDDRNSKNNVNYINSRPSAEQQIVEQKKVCEIIANNDRQKEKYFPPITEEMGI